VATTDVHGPVRARHVAAAAIALVAALLVGSAVAVGGAGHGNPRVVRLPLDDIPAGVSARQVGTVPVVFVRQGEDITAFLNDVANRETISFCPGLNTAGIFLTPIYESQFALDGRKLGGPAPCDLDRVRTRVDGDVLVVSTDTILLGDGSPTPAPAVPRLHDGWEDDVLHPPSSVDCGPPGAVDGHATRG
jgi:hypothetical protein